MGADKAMLEVEGGTPEWCMKILRHEAGHATPGIQDDVEGPDRRAVDERKPADEEARRLHRRRTPADVGQRGADVLDRLGVETGRAEERPQRAQHLPRGARVAQHDLLELFSSSYGTFSDGTRDNFLQVKFAGDIYDGYDGRVKLQAGPEWYGDAECGGWTSEYDWNPDGSYDFTVSFTGIMLGLSPIFP